MELTSKQRAYLKTLSGKIEPIFQIGKASLTPAMTESISDALEKRELGKISVLKNCFDDPRELADMAAERTHSAVVQVIGKRFILYRPSKKNPKIELPLAAKPQP